MQKKYGIFIIILLFLISGLGVSLINRYYSFNYIYNLLFHKELAINPKVEVRPEKEYLISIWYYPFYRTIVEGENPERDFFLEAARRLKELYPNIKLKIRRLDFIDGHQELLQSLQEGQPPDIYLNFQLDSLIDENLQVPLDIYLSPEEREGFYTVNWQKINRENHLWGLPFLVQPQNWWANFNLATAEFNEQLSVLPKESLALNYLDPLLLRQFLTLKGIENLQEEKQGFREILDLMQELKEKENFAISCNRMPETFLKLFLEEEGIVIGPANPWLEQFLEKKLKELYPLKLNNLVRVYYLNVFRQRKYQGHDHTRAAVEVARIISKELGGVLAEKLGLEAPYQAGLKGVTPLLELNLQEQSYFQEVVLPLWQEFWEQGLTPEEVMKRLN